MKKIIAIVFCLIVWAHVNSFAQEQIKENKPVELRLFCGGPRQNFPLMIVNDKHVVEVLDIIKIDDVNEITILKNTDSLTKIYGLKTKNGIIKIKLNDDVKLLNLNELYNQLHIQANSRQLPLYVNDKKISNKDQFIAARHWINKAEIVNNKIDKTKKSIYINFKTTP